MYIRYQLFKSKRRQKKIAKQVTLPVLFQIVDDLSAEIYNLICEIEEVREDLDFLLYELDSQLDD